MEQNYYSKSWRLKANLLPGLFGDSKENCVLVVRILAPFCSHGFKGIAIVL